MKIGCSVAAALGLSAFAATSLATEPDASSTVPNPTYEVVIVAPYATGVDRDLVPANVQSASSKDIERLQPLDLSDLLNRSFGSVSINHAQNNPLQPDLNFRGFTASPLLGLPIGLSVYQDGVRINEPFGDTVNWDLISTSAIEDVQMIAGANPVFGLNTLGGALSLRMKNGFTFQGTDVGALTGSFGRQVFTAESGGNNGTWGYYANADYFQEDGWRDFSASNALRLYGAASYRGEGSTLDLSLAHADTKLRGNGTSPIELLQEDREAVFTYPDITQNKLTQVIVTGTQDLSSIMQLAGNVFYRKIRTRSFNGDGTIFEECGDFLCEEDSGQPLRDQNGDLIPAELDDEELNAINNIGRREQKGYGLSGQLNLRADAFAHKNVFSIGAAWSRGETDYGSAIEVASLTEDRSTTTTGIFADELRTAVSTSVDTSSLYFVDSFSLTEAVALTLAGRYNDIRTKLNDESGINPDLNGRHSFSRFNPAIGVTAKIAPTASLYASAGESARAPSPVELACASEDAPCNLPNAFLADPPLKQVVARDYEIGLRGGETEGLRWNVDYFYTLNRDDILFQTTGGAQGNVGFFQNAADTRRKGLELEFSRKVSNLTWFADYSYVKATYENDFVVSSPNHPVFDPPVDDSPQAPQIVGDGQLLVTKGRTIPGIPRHQANLGLDVALDPNLSIGGDASLRSGVYLRGDEVNLLSKTGSYAVFNLHAQYRYGDHTIVYARVENLFDRDYETFGILGEPGEVFPTFADPRFYGAGPPQGAWIGVKVKL
jgi:outer membrane receptor protein involved in Fe transport